MSELQITLPKGSFPKIHYPSVITVDNAASLFLETEPVIAVEVNGQARAYPLNILTMHEIINDTLGGMSILPTFCPLCNSAIVFDRTLKSQPPVTLEFEVSGMLRKSDMVMYDTRTESYWQQLTGEGIVGEYTGEELDAISSLVLSFQEFVDRFPWGTVVSPRNGSDAEHRYGINPYVRYDDPAGAPYERFADLSSISNVLPPMERVVTLNFEPDAWIIPFSKLEKDIVVNDVFSGVPTVIFYSSTATSVLDQADIASSRVIGSATAFSPVVNGRHLTFEEWRGRFRDIETRSVWTIAGFCTDGELRGTQLNVLPHSIHFAFASLSFYPRAQVVQ